MGERQDKYVVKMRCSHANLKDLYDTIFKRSFPPLTEHIVHVTIVLGVVEVSLTVSGITFICL